LSDAQVAAVVNYVRTRFGNKFKANATAAQVGALPHPGGNSSEE
jgi:mono/diheme cytochrome c family protein